MLIPLLIKGVEYKFKLKQYPHDFENTENKITIFLCLHYTQLSEFFCYILNIVYRLAPCLLSFTAATVIWCSYRKPIRETEERGVEETKMMFPGRKSKQAKQPSIKSRSLATVIRHGVLRTGCSIIQSSNSSLLHFSFEKYFPSWGDQNRIASRVKQ